MKDTTSFPFVCMLFELRASGWEGGGGTEGKLLSVKNPHSRVSD